MRKIFTLLIACCLTFSLAACGKKGGLEAPEGSQFPHKYPRQ